MDVDEVTRLGPSSVAVVLIDFQNDFCRPPAGASSPASQNAATARRAREFAAEAQALGVHAVYTRQVLDFERLTPRQRRRESSDGLCAAGTVGAELFLSPIPGATVVTKDRFDVWQSEQWLDYLQQHKIDGLVITGVELRCCVLYAVLGADERGYAYTVPLDLVSGVDAGEKSDNEWVRRYLRDVHDAPANSAQLLNAWRALTSTTG